MIVFIKHKIMVISKHVTHVSVSQRQTQKLFHVFHSQAHVK